jgi:hypothetical protein
MNEEKGEMPRKTAVSIIMVLLSVCVLSLAFRTDGFRAEAAGEITTIRMLNPATNDGFFLLNASDYPLGSQFTVDFYVAPINDLISWQVKVTWDNSILNFQSASIPAGHVFEGAIAGGATISQVGPTVDIDAGVGNATLAMMSSPPYSPVNVADAGLLCTMTFSIQALPVADQLYAQITFIPGETFVVLSADPGTSQPVFTAPATIGILNVQITPDLDGDHSVTIGDVILVADAFGSYPMHPRWNVYADLNLDGRITIDDVAAILRDFGTSVP